MIIDDDFRVRSNLYEEFFRREHPEIDIAFNLYSVEYCRDLLSELRMNYKNIDAFFIDARLDAKDKGWEQENGLNFYHVLTQIEKVYTDLTVPPIFVLSRYWQTEGGLLTSINRAFSVFHNPLHASRYYSQHELETTIQQAQTLDTNGKLILTPLYEERKYIADEILKTRSLQYNSTSPVDLVLQLAVPDEKKSAYQVLGLSEDDDKYLSNYGISYQETTIDDYHVVVVPQASMGMTDAARAATAAILAFKPRLIAMTGICAGKKGKTNLCDLVVANFTFDYSAGKLLKDSWEHRPKPMIIDAGLDTFVTTNLINNAHHIFADIKDKYNGEAPSERKIHFTSMASGPWVVDNASIFTEIETHLVSNCYTLDMEAYGVAAAAHQLHTPWLIMKSVQDYADGKKNETEQKSRAYASFSSTYVLVKYLSKIMRFIK